MTDAQLKQMGMMIGAGVITALIVSFVQRNLLPPPVAKNDQGHNDWFMNG